MASQSFIIEGENTICALTPTIQNLRDAFQREIATNAGGDDSRAYKENADCWGTLAVNAEVLLDNLADLIRDINNHGK